MSFEVTNYNFAQNLLSAAATGVPQSLNTSLTSLDYTVAVTALSGYVGLAFPELTLTPGNSARVGGSFAGNTFLLPNGYHNEFIGLIAPNNSVTIFQFNSGSTAQTSISGNTTNATYPLLRRKVLMGYI